MRFAAPLVRGRLVRRSKRFLADVEVDGVVVTAHVANTGAMLGLDAPGLEVWLSPAASPGRKLAWSWELCRVGGGLVCVNTGHPNRVAAEAVAAGAIPELAGYARLRREVRYGRASRVDLLLEDGPTPTCHVEVKSVTLERGGWAEFPDARTARGTRHLAELRQVVAEGGRAVMLFLVQRGDCHAFRPAADIDPVYAAALRDAVRDGVEAICYTCRPSLDGIEMGGRLPVSPAAGEDA